MKNIVKKHNRMILDTAQEKQRNKLVKSKKGWLKVSLGTLVLSSALFTFTISSNADTNPDAVQQPQNEQVVQQNTANTSDENIISDNVSESQDSKNVQVSQQEVNSTEVSEANQPTQQATVANSDQNKVVSQYRLLTTNLNQEPQVQDHTYDVPDSQNVRTDPSLNAEITGQLHNGQSIHYDYNQEADGYNWLHYNNYAGQDRWTADLRNDQSQPQQAPAAPVATNNDQSTSNSGTYTLSGVQNVRTDASLNAGVTGQLEAGYTISYNGTREADGYNWLHYNNYAGQDRWVADMNGTTANQTQPAAAPVAAPVVTNNEQSTSNSGTYTLSGVQNVRTDASLNAGVTGQLEAGYTISYNGTREADGYNWLHYNNYAGQDRWVADMNGTTANQTQPATTPVAPVVTNSEGESTNNSGTYTLSGVQNVRTDASLNAGVTGQLEAGYTISYNGTREADGYNWLHYNNYAGQDRWVADMNGTTANQTQPATTPVEPVVTNSEGESTNNSGTYTLSGVQNVRTDASLNAGVTGQLEAGYTISYNGTREADGYTWLHYNNYAGQDRWIADVNGSDVPMPSNEIPKAPANLSAEDQAEYIINVASQFLGEPYVWAGANPSQGFDCSGLTSYTFGQANVQIPRRSEEQYKYSKHIDASEARRGDLVFFSKTYDDGTNWDPNSMTHVGIYLGNGKMLDSETNGIMIEDVTNFSSYYPTFYGRYLDFK